VAAKAGVEDSPIATTAIEIVANAKFLIFFPSNCLQNGSLQSLGLEASLRQDPSYALLRRKIFAALQ
jgi:hypothetical protein